MLSSGLVDGGVAPPATELSVGPNRKLISDDSRNWATVQKLNNYVPKKGDRVVAAWSGNSWYTGTIVETGGEKVKVKWADNSSDSNVDEARIALYPAVGSAGTPFQSGDVLLVKPTSGSNWKFAEATSGKEVRFNDSTTRSVRGDEYILFN